MSILLLGLVIIFLMEKIFYLKFFSPHDWKAASIFGVIASLVLYPSALGLTRIDTYGWGWASLSLKANIAFVLLITSAALVTIFLLWKRNRFGMVLFIGLLAFALHVKASTNFWDYFIDPIYGTIAILLFFCLLLLLCKE